MSQLVEIALGSGVTLMIAVALFVITMVGVRYGLKATNLGRENDYAYEPEVAEPSHAAIWRGRDA